MPEKLCHTEELGWLFIDLIILLHHKEKRWMPSYLLGTKWASLPKMREKTFWTRMKGCFCSYSSKVRRETLSSNKFGISTASAFFFDLMLDKAVIQGILSRQTTGHPPLRITVTLSWRSYQRLWYIVVVLLHLCCRGAKSTCFTTKKTLQYIKGSYLDSKNKYLFCRHMNTKYCDQLHRNW